ncbi:MAG: hypothetical protein QW197_01675 [Candidatus Aenigmatarchaeota archaeon]
MTHYLREIIQNLYESFPIFCSSSTYKHKQEEIKIEKRQNGFIIYSCKKNDCPIKVYILQQPNEIILRISLIWPKKYKIPSRYFVFAISDEYIYIDYTKIISKNQNSGYICNEIKASLEKLLSEVE